MVKENKIKQHIQLKLTRQGNAVSPRGGGNKNPTTTANLGNRQGHGKRLKNSVDSLVNYWQDIKEQREEEEEEERKPTLPDAVPLILKIDPSSFNLDGFKSYDIEVIADLEDGYIIGASADIQLSELQKKIEQFIKEERGGTTVAEIWEIIDGTKRPEYILSEELLEHWHQVKDEQTYTVDIGISCVGIKSKLPDFKEKKSDESIDKYIKRTQKWIEKRELTYQQWDDIKSEREDEFTAFVQGYNGEILNIIDGHIPQSAELPDSFSCRIKISGKGLKDLVFNFPYIFDVSEPDEFAEIVPKSSLSDADSHSFQLEPPEPNAPKVCNIDSGIQERNTLLRPAIDSPNSKSWVPGEISKTSDYVSNGGHGTRVAGAILYPRSIPRGGSQKAICWIQNARVLDANCQLPQSLFPPNLLGDIVSYYTGTGTKLFNHSITGSVPCRKQYMSAWAAAIDNLTWQNDILFIVAAGNLPLDTRTGLTRLSVKEHLVANRTHPDYLLENSCRIANPAQSFQALTVGSIASCDRHVPPYSSISKKDQPSAFSCSGLGIWETIKPEVVEYGGDLVRDEGTPPNITFPQEVCPELVRSTLGGGPVIASDKVGTSFAAPKVTHILARIAAELPNENCLLYRALVAQSARWLEWAISENINKKDVLRHIGYGLPDVNRALGNAPNRITLITQGERRIKARQADVYQVKLPEELLSQGEELEILVEVTLSYKAQPRRTRRNRRKYLSTWLDWDCSKKGEDPDSFLARILKEYDAPDDAEKGEGTFKWELGKQNRHGNVKDVPRSAGTLQKDWTVVKSFQLREAFCIAVVGHQGWNNDPDAQAPYSLVVSFEALESNIPIYNTFVEAQVELEVEQQVEI